MSTVIAFAVRALLVALFLPFSALDKCINREAAIDQAQHTLGTRGLSAVFIAMGLCVEVIASLAILSGVVDRFAALVMAVYCVATAVLWKRFWRSPDFRLRGASRGRDVFWDFLKNIALAGGFLLLTFGATADGVQRFIDHPFASSHPYGSQAGAP
jgi:putative oxidoreductase